MSVNSMYEYKRVSEQVILSIHRWVRTTCNRHLQGVERWSNTHTEAHQDNLIAINTGVSG
jgi:hypothetical protein